MSIRWRVSEREHPQKCHFLYFLERPLQQFCTTVQTVMSDDEGSDADDDDDDDDAGGGDVTVACCNCVASEMARLQEDVRRLRFWRSIIAELLGSLFVVFLGCAAFTVTYDEHSLAVKVSISRHWFRCVNVEYHTTEVKQVLSHPHPYQKIPDIYLLLSVPLPICTFINCLFLSCIYSMRSIRTFFIHLFLFCGLLLSCSIVLFGLSTTGLNKTTTTTTTTTTSEQNVETASDLQMWGPDTHLFVVVWVWGHSRMSLHNIILRTLSYSNYYLWFGL